MPIQTDAGVNRFKDVTSFEVRHCRRPFPLLLKVQGLTAMDSVENGFDSASTLPIELGRELSPRDPDLLERIAATECSLCGVTGVPIEVHRLRRLRDVRKSAIGRRSAPWPGPYRRRRRGNRH